MSTLKSSAATSGLAPSAAESADEEESLCAHACRSLRCAISATATGIIDSGISALQGLRGKVGGAENADKDRGGDKPGSRTGRSGGRPDAQAEAKEEAPRPRRRLRALLVYLSLVLAGGMGGGALAYHLLEELLARRAAENLHMKGEMAKHAKSIVIAEKKFEEAKAKLIEAEKKLETFSVVETEKKVAEAQAGRIEAEKKLEASLAESARIAAERQIRLGEAVRLLERIIASERAVKSHPPGNRGGASGASLPLKTGNCTLDSGMKAESLKQCIKDFNG